MSAQTVLVVDDDDNIREIMKLYLVNEGYHVEEAADGIEALRKVEVVKPAIILLDVMMPILDGMEVCRQIRKFSRVPVIMLTARSVDEDKILGLGIGADDYVTKPFNPNEVVARVKAVLRRALDPLPVENNILRFPQLEINATDHTVTAFGKTVPLTIKEMDLLLCLASHPGRTYTRELLLETVWGYAYPGETRTVDSHISRLRNKIGASETTPWDIKAIWGVGYRFEVKS
jgi:DNA-binding response OmpR family regulator